MYKYGACLSLKSMGYGIKPFISIHWYSSSATILLVTELEYDFPFFLFAVVKFNCQSYYTINSEILLLLIIFIMASSASRTDYNETNETKETN